MRITRIATLAWLGAVVFTLPAQAAQVCGDGVIQYPESCDDGNTVAGDACPNDCGVQPETSTIAIAGSSFPEGDPGSQNFVNPSISRTGTSAFGINVGFRTVQDTALAGSDFVGVTGRREHLPYTASAVGPRVDFIEDLLAELDEQFNVEIYGAYRTGAITMIPGAHQVAAGDAPYRIAVADLNADGQPDIVAANITPNTLGVFPNASTPGSLSFPSKTTIADTPSPYALAVGDLDGDGNPDIVVSDFANGGIATLRHVTSPGIATFEAKQPIVSVPGMHSFAIADFDGDGKLDVAAANLPEDAVFAWRNTSTTGTVALTAAAAPFAAGDGARDVAVADFDGDGKPDLAVTIYLVDKVAILRNTSTSGTISFAAPVTQNTGDFPSGVAVEDFNADGLPDIAVVNASANTVTVIQNASVGASLSFASGPTLAVYGTSPYFLASGDIDGDLKADLVASNFGGDRISVLRNTTSSAGITPTFANAEHYATGSGPYGVAIADFDGDAQADVVTADAGHVAGSGDTLTFTRNNRPTVTITTDSAAVTITNDDEPKMAFANETGTVDESDGSTTVTVTMLGVTDETVNVSYTLGGTATQGVDYTISPATLSFAPGDTSKTLTISGLADAANDSGATETIVITLLDPSNAGLNPPNPHTLTITNDSVPVVTPPPSEPEQGGGGGGAMSLGLLLLALVRRRSR